MVSTVKTIFWISLLAAAICVPIVLLMHHSLMPNAAELAQLDTLVQKAAPPESTVHRLSAPDRVEIVGDTKSGYFTYEVVGKGPVEKYRADWRLAGGQVDLVSFKKL